MLLFMYVSPALAGRQRESKLLGVDYKHLDAPVASEFAVLLIYLCSLSK